MKLKIKKISLVRFFLVFYLFSGLIIPINAAFANKIYDCDIDIENEYSESCQENQNEDCNVKSTDIFKNKKNIEENDVEEFDDAFLGSFRTAEEHYCIIQTNKLNLDNLLVLSLQPYKIVQFNCHSQQQNIIDPPSVGRNTLEKLRTVILLE